MVRKRRFYRRWNTWNSRRYRQFKKANYLAYKIDVSGDLVFPTSDGQPVFSNTNSSTIPFSSFLGGSSATEFQKFKGIFTFYRIRGIRMEFVPSSGNSTLSTITHTKPVYAGFFLSGANTQLSDLPTVNQSILLNPLQKSAKYFYLYGAQDDWKLFDTGYSGFFGTYSAENASDNTGPAWSYRITFYITFKYAKT